MLALLEVLPHAELLASVYDPGAAWPSKLANRPIRTTWLNRLPGARRQYPKLLPLMDGAYRRMDVSGYDLVVSSSHAFAKNVRTADSRRPGRPLHVCYCHTPMRYAWDPAFLDGEELGLAGATAFRALVGKLRRDDLRGAAQVDHFLANSSVVAERIARHYGREADVVHPPVEVAAHLASPRAEDTQSAPYLVFGRVVPYKRVDVAVRACHRLGRPLVVAGGGRDLARVRALPEAAGVDFRGRVDPDELQELLAGSRALLFPGEEDFGIVPVEAQAAGLPVIGNADGGVRDSVRDGRSGVLYSPGEDPVGALADAMERFEGLDLLEDDVRASATEFGPERFADAFTTALEAAAAGCH